MHTFQYTARDRTGSKVSGWVEAADRRSAIRKVESMGAIPVSVEPVSHSSATLPPTHRSAAPSPQQPNQMEQAIARQKSYVGAAVVIFFVYWLFYLPGLIVNILYLNDANETAKIAGRAPAGYGCIVVMLILGLLPLLFILWIMGVIFI